MPNVDLMQADKVLRKREVVQHHLRDSSIGDAELWRLTQNTFDELVNTIIVML